MSCMDFRTIELEHDRGHSDHEEKRQRITGSSCHQRGNIYLVKKLLKEEVEKCL